MKVRPHRRSDRGFELNAVVPYIMTMEFLPLLRAGEVPLVLQTSSSALLLEQNLTDLNREGFPLGTNSDSHCVLGMEASTHGQAIVGGFADQGYPSG